MHCRLAEIARFYPLSARVEHPECKTQGPAAGEFIEYCIARPLLSATLLSALFIEIGPTDVGIK